MTKIYFCVSTIVFSGKTARIKFASLTQQLYKLLLQSKVNAKTLCKSERLSKSQNKKKKRTNGNYHWRSCGIRVKCNQVLHIAPSTFLSWKCFVSFAPDVFLLSAAFVLNLFLLCVVFVSKTFVLWCNRVCCGRQSQTAGKRCSMILLCMERVCQKRIFWNEQAIQYVEKHNRNDV